MNWKDKLKEKAEKDWLVWSVEPDGEYNEDVYTPLIESDFYPEVENFIDEVVAEVRKEIFKDLDKIDSYENNDVAAIKLTRYLMKMEKELKGDK